ncbi:MAG: type II secretion system F family protein [Verrucomicrobiaceae bacterium]|nr:type II secretion system F family protein [Verrucomicrobiaceae bacterium]
MIFSYKAFDKTNALKTGTIDVADKFEAKKALASQGLKIVSLKQTSANTLSPEKTTKGEKGGGEKIALMLFKKLLQLCESGAMPVSDALKSLSARSLNPKIKSLSKNLYKDLSEGKLLAVAMERYPDTFDSCVRHLVEAGEATANLPFVFKNIIKYIDDRQNLRKTIFSALAYPVFLCLMACGVVLLFLFFMLPEIKAMMSNMGAEENFPIMMMEFIGKALTNGAPVLAVLAVCIFVFLKYMRRTKEGRQTSDRWFLKIPIISDIIFNAEVARFSSLCSALFASGVNSTDVFLMAEKSVKNEEIKSRFKSFRTAVNDGGAISLSMQKFKLLEYEDIDIISVGEKTGSLVSGFAEIAKVRAETLEHKIKFSTGILGGIALITAFILVFIFAMGIVLSILGLSQSIAG